MTSVTNFSGRRSRFTVGALSITVASLFGTACEQGPVTAPLHPQAARASAISAAQTNRQAALTDLARAVALTLADPATRMAVKNDLRASRFGHEHKVEFASYVNGNGGAMRGRMARASGKSDADIQALLAGGKNMELYMPVKAHRESWKGDAEVIVAAQLNDQTTPVGFRLDGTPVALSLGAPPSTPTLVIVPSETDFMTPLDATWGNTNDAGGAAIGTLERGAKNHGTQRMIVDPCSDPSSDVYPCTAPPATYPAGLYIDYMNLYDWKESWPRGDPEVEAHLIGPTFDPNSQGEHLSCTSQTQGGSKYYDQNGHEWSAPTYSVEGQLFTADELTRYQAVYNKPFVIQFWEDDQDSCEIVKEDKSQLQQVSEDLSTVYHAASVVISLLSYSYPGTFVFSSSAVTALRALAKLNVWDNEDDYLGQVTLLSDVGISHPGMTHSLVLNASGTSLSENGYMRLRYRQ